MTIELARTLSQGKWVLNFLVLLIDQRSPKIYSFKLFLMIFFFGKSITKIDAYHCIINNTPMTQPMKMSLIDKIKSVFKSKPAPYKTYAPAQLRVTAMRARIYLQQHFKKCIQLIQAEDSVLFQRKQSPGDCYRIMQEIGKHVIEVESIKIYMEILRKIQDRSASIIKTNGDIALLKTQLNWFQCLLWYRKCRKITGLDELHAFCFNFFKGVDVTCQITPRCQIFKICPIMLYLDPDCIIPIKKIYPDITTYINTKLDFQFLNQLFKVNKNDIKRWVNQAKIQYREKYISKSKSPVKIQKNTPPKKAINTNNEIDFTKKQPREDIHINNHSENSDSGSNSHLQKKPSFMRKIMESSKLKSKPICAECGIAIETDTIMDNEKQHEEVASFSKICQSCQKNKKIQEQEHPKKQEPNISIVCKVCHKIISNSADLSFNGSSGNKSFSFSEDICNECLQNQQKQRQNHEINESNYNLIEQQSHSRENKKQELPPNFIENKQKDPFEQIDIDLPQQKIAEKDKKYEQEFDDQEESLRFIRQHVVEKKKPIKKPYMVSIYARAQYVNQSFKK